MTSDEEPLGGWACVQCRFAAVYSDMLVCGDAARLTGSLRVDGETCERVFVCVCVCVCVGDWLASVASRT